MKRATLLVGIAALTLVGQTPILARADTNDDLARRVQRAIARYTYFTVFDDVHADIDREGSIVLHGHVTSPHKRTDLANRVMAVDGVDRVQDDLEVLPVSQFDNELRYRVARSIYGSSTFWHYAARRNPPIHIVVKHGHVTLTGVVNNESDKAIAGVLAGSSGAFSLRNELKVPGRDLREDEQSEQRPELTCDDAVVQSTASCHQPPAGSS